MRSSLHVTPWSGDSSNSALAHVRLGLRLAEERCRELVRKVKDYPRARSCNAACTRTVLRDFRKHCALWATLENRICLVCSTVVSDEVNKRLRRITSA